VFDVKADYSVKAPKESFGKTVMWATDGNNLTPQNPKQEVMPFAVRKLDESSAPVRKV
jgi:hypothetical protein